MSALDAFLIAGGVVCGYLAVGWNMIAEIQRRRRADTVIRRLRDRSPQGRFHD